MHSCACAFMHVCGCTLVLALLHNLVRSCSCACIIAHTCAVVRLCLHYCTIAYPCAVMHLCPCACTIAHNYAVMRLYVRALVLALLHTIMHVCSVPLCRIRSAGQAEQRNPANPAYMMVKPSRTLPTCFPYRTC